MTAQKAVFHMYMNCFKRNGSLQFPKNTSATLGEMPGTCTACCAYVASLCVTMCRIDIVDRCNTISVESQLRKLQPNERLPKKLLVGHSNGQLVLGMLAQDRLLWKDKTLPCTYLAHMIMSWKALLLLSTTSLPMVYQPNIHIIKTCAGMTSCRPHFEPRCQLQMRGWQSLKLRYNTICMLCRIECDGS